MTTPSIVAGYTTQIDAGNTTSRTIAVPTHISGDQMFIAVATDAAADTITVSGFTPLYNNVDVDGAATFALFQKTAGGSEGATYTILTVASERCVAIAWAVRDYVNVDAQGTNQTGSGATATVPAVTSTVANTLRISIVATDNQQTTPIGTISGHTPMAEVWGTSAAAISVQSKVLPSAGLDSSATASLSLSDQWLGIAFAVAGITTPTYTQSVSGGITPTGAIVKQANKRTTGTVAPSGTLRRSAAKRLAGTVALAGVVRKQTARRLASTVTLSGTVATLKGHLYTQILAGAVGLSGVVRKQAVKRLTGTVTLAGGLVKGATKRLAGTVALAGSLVRGRVTGPILPNRKRGSIFSQNSLSYLIGQSDFTQDVISYGHSHQALGGMWTADLALRQPLHDLEDWIENGVGRHVEVRGGATALAWEGKINRVTINVGGYNMTIGPYLDISNKINLAYSVFLDLGGGQATGIRLVSDYVQDTASMARYGVLETTFNAGGISSDNVTELLPMLLERYSQPPRSEDLDLRGNLTTQFDVRLECIGYGHLFSKYTYNSGTTGTVALSTKLANIVAAEPNGLFTSRVAVNTLAVPAYENDNADAWGLIKGLVAYGDSSQQRYTFGVYEDRRAVYAPVRNEVVYIRPLREGFSVIQDVEGGLLQPWQVRPGSYVMVTDLLPGRPAALDLNDDVRAIFANTVQFRAPDSLVINGAHAFRLEQRLAQLGIGGIG